jgi:hypothetical protein
MRRDAATYVYCLVESPVAPRVSDLPAGLAGLGPPRALDAGRPLWLIVADAPLARYGPAPVERGLRDLSWVSARALAHEAVVERCARAGTVIPMKLLTLFTGDDRAVAHVRRRRRSIARVLARVAGRAEWGLRVRFDPARARRAPPGPRPRTGAGGQPGTRFLQLRSRQQDAERRLAARARVEALRVYRRLRALADEGRRRALPDGAAPSLLLDAVLLVGTRTTRRLRREAARLGAEGASAGLEIVLTGPWPAYHFAARPR